MSKVSIIVPTYNRASIVSRAISSVLKQDFSDWELIVVDDGSTDNTQQVLHEFQDDIRVTIIKHAHNRGVSAAKNTGLDHIRGEWFTILDSDDEIVPNALSSMLNVPHTIDPNIDAVSCNCIDTSTNKFSGTGLSHDQYLDARTIMDHCKGEFWGITKTSLLGQLRFNERLPGFEGTVWSRIDVKAHRYYLHQGLRKYYTQGDDRVTKIQRRFDAVSWSKVYQVLLTDEQEYLQTVKDTSLVRYRRIAFNACRAFIGAGDRKQARWAYHELCTGGRNRLSWLIAPGLILGPTWITLINWGYAQLGKLSR